MRSAGRGGASAAGPLLAVALVLVAINLRPAAAGIGPLIGRIRHDTGLSGTGAGVLATLPVLCFGGLAPVVPALARRLGAHTAIAASLWLLLTGLLVRLVPGVGFLFLGTMLAGAAIAVGNVLMPVLVRRDFPSRTGLMTALYTTSLIAFAALAAGVSVPVGDALGGGWRPALGIWAVPAALALLVWLPHLWRAQPEPAGSEPSFAGARTLLGSRLAWQLTLFFGIQSASFYATLAWLPSVFQSHGASAAHAGLLLSLSMVVGLAGALTVPTLATRARDQRMLVVGCGSCTALGWLGVLLAPNAAPYLWVAVLGLGQNASFPLAMTMVVLRGGTVASTTGLSTLVQTVGYLLAAVGPLAIGALHDLSGSWTPALVVLIAALAPQTVAGIAAGRNRSVAPPRAEPSPALDAG